MNQLKESEYAFLLEKGNLDQKKDFIYTNPPVWFQSIIVANEESKDVLEALAKHTSYPDIIRDLFEKGVNLCLNNKYIPTDILGKIYDQRPRKFITLDALVVHPNISTEILNDLKNVDHPASVGKIARLRLLMRKYLQPNESEFSFLISSKFINFDEDS